MAEVEGADIQEILLRWIKRWAEGWMWLGAIVVTVTGFILVFLSFSGALKDGDPVWLYVVRELGMGLIITGLVTGVVRIFIVRYHDRFQNMAQRFLHEDVSRRLDELTEGVSGQTHQLINASSSLQALHEAGADQTKRLIGASGSLQALHEAGISRIYASRESAAQDIRLDLQRPDVTEIRLIGISLNDFARPEDRELGEAWKTIISYVRNPERNGRKIDIKILVIDSYSLGAHLRSEGEARLAGITSSRLQDDVRNTTWLMTNLRREAAANDNVEFDFRLYRLPPILFLCATDRVCYAQQYHFWAARTESDIPVVRSEVLRGPATAGTGMLDEMRAHFDWIWEHASIGPEEYAAHEHGVDRPLAEVGAVNVYADSAEGKQRIAALLETTQERLYLVGISLKSFFEIDVLFRSIGAMIARGVEVRCLILDPTSEQAQYRSFREHLFINEKATFDEYRASDAHLRSPLYQDTVATIRRIRTILLPAVEGKFFARLYATSPSCFMMLSDDRILVEQYHYGNAQDEQERVPMILGKDMPLVEFSAHTPSLYPDRDPRRNPYALLSEHFDFIFRKCSRDIWEFPLDE